MLRRLLAVGTVLLAALVFTSAAGAATLGITTAPAGASLGTDVGVVVAQITDTPGTPFIVPSGGGQVTQWQTLTNGDTAGSSLTFVVLRAVSGGYTVVGADTETLPNPLPSSGVASFSLSQPIAVQAGDTLGLYSSASNVTFFYNGAVPMADNVLAATGSPAAGQALSLVGTGNGAYEMNLAVTLATGEDASVQTSAFPSVAEVGSPSLLSSVVTNPGPSTGTLTFVDAVPTGLQIQSATADYGSCTVSGQTVTCMLSPPAGQSATVDVVVTPSQAGSFANVATVTSTGQVDPNAANNTATSDLVVAVLPQKCIVPGFRKLPLAFARTVLRELGCGVKVTTRHSSIRKGLVISTTQPVGTYPYQQVVTLVVSSGPKVRKHRKRR